jgi:hypothetical protein
MSPNKLRKVADNLLLGQVNRPKDLVEIISNIKYKVKEILVV